MTKRKAKKPTHNYVFWKFVYLFIFIVKFVFFFVWLFLISFSCFALSFTRYLSQKVISWTISLWQLLQLCFFLFPVIQVYFYMVIYWNCWRKLPVLLENIFLPFLLKWRVGIIAGHLFLLFFSSGKAAAVILF